MAEPAELDVLGIGNALVDVLSHASDEMVTGLGLVKGTMSLIDEARARELYEATGPGVEISGGSAANTIVGVASFGGRGSDPWPRFSLCTPCSRYSRRPRSRARRISPPC